MTDTDNIMTVEALRTLSAQDLLTFGLHHVAYVKPTDTALGTVYVVYSADGRMMSQQNDEPQAAAAARQNSLEPVRVH